MDRSVHVIIRGKWVRWVLPTQARAGTPSAQVSTRVRIASSE